MLNPFSRKKDDFADLDVYTEENENFDETKIIEPSIEEITEDTEKETKRYRRYKRIINIIFLIIIFILMIIAVDTIAVSRYNVGPFFAIKTKTLKDGGTKIYYGLGYKVIKYHQVQGRRDMELGYWNLEYNTTPIDISDIDLAIEFENNYEETSKKYYKKFLRFSSTVKEINEDKNQLVLEYLDEGGKYTLTIYCNMAEKKSNLSIYNIGDKVNVIGTVNKFEIKNTKESNKLHLNYCFAESTASVEIVEIEE